MTRVLLICNLFDDKWVGSLVRSLKKQDPALQIEIFNTHIQKNVPWPAYTALCAQIYAGKRHAFSVLYKIPKIRTFLWNIDIYWGFHKWIKLQKEKYDVINLHYLLPIFKHCISDLSRGANTVLLSPWGSDVLRVKKRTLKKLMILVKRMDYVSCDKAQIRFQNDIADLLHVSENKWIHLGFGTEMIDVINRSTQFTREQAKEKMGLSAYYIVVCGYNGHKAQNHLKIIEAIATKKECLPKNLLLLFPMTYGGEEPYMAHVEKKIKSYGFSYQILRHYLSNENLLLVRKCADIFIHAQETDANSGTLAEYLLCRTKIINGSWLAYPHREKYGKPYYEFDHFDQLGKLMVQVYHTRESLIDDRLVLEIAQMGWEKMGKQWVDFYHSCAK